MTNNVNQRHFPFWPERMPFSLSVPETPVHDNLLVTARRYPNRTAIYYYGTRITYRELLQQVEWLSGYLSSKLSVQKGDRVALLLQNSPQFFISYYAILRADAIVVPINPMNVLDEVRFYIQDSGARVAIAAEELLDHIAPLCNEGILDHVITARYGDYLSDLNSPLVPEVCKLPPRAKAADFGTIPWQETLAARCTPIASTVQPHDIAVLPYTSGTTGVAKGCIHTHYSVQANIVGGSVWATLTSNAVVLCTLPLFHVTGMEHSMNAPIYSGSTAVVMTRWNRDTAAQLIQDLRCTHWKLIATMVIDFLANPKLSQYDLSSIRSIGGGGAPVPKAIAEKFFEVMGRHYVEGYGLSETISTSHVNPPDRPKDQCAGIPAFDVDARVIHTDTEEELSAGEEGEIVIHGPQVFEGYWNRPEENEKAFIVLDGKKFFRTGDIGSYDEEGYFFIVDRVKRMVNASGFKVWPTEVESVLYKNPAVEQACVIGVPDERRGETVKAFIVLNPAYQGRVTEQDMIDWSKEHMAAYKYPRQIEFVDKLPMSGSGKVLWRVLQDEERKKIARA